MYSPNSDEQQNGTAPIWSSRLSEYQAWLAKQNRSPHTKRAYYSQVKQFLMFLEHSKRSYKEILEVPSILEFAAREYVSQLKYELKLGPSSINNSLVALDNFCQFLGIQNRKIEREPRLRPEQKTLTPIEQQHFHKSAEQQQSSRDRALALVLFYTGLRIGECARLNVEDVSLSSNKAVLTVQAKHFRDRATSRAVSVNHVTKEALRSWLVDRAKFHPNYTQSALWISRHGQRFSIAGIDFVIRRIGWQAHLTVSSELLRQTHLVNNSTKTTTLTLASEIDERIGIIGMP